jgi:hypothetical protein
MLSNHTHSLWVRVQKETEENESSEAGPQDLPCHVYARRLLGPTLSTEGKRAITE